MSLWGMGKVTASWGWEGDLSCAKAPGSVWKDLWAYLQECFTENRAGSTRKHADRFLSFLRGKDRKMKQVCVFKKKSMGNYKAREAFKLSPKLQLFPKFQELTAAKVQLSHNFSHCTHNRFCWACKKKEKPSNRGLFKRPWALLANLPPLQGYANQPFSKPLEFRSSTVLTQLWRPGRTSLWVYQNAKQEPNVVSRISTASTNCVSIRNTGLKTQKVTAGSFPRPCSGHSASGGMWMDLWPLSS